jgi:8-hydroxy-5-deazaflavin:NADPH oxidoreductase
MSRSDAAMAADSQSIRIGIIGFEPVVIGGLAMGKYLMPGTALAGEHKADEVRSIAATLKP